jgi:hypothetical protein
VRPVLQLPQRHHPGGAGTCRPAYEAGPVGQLPHRHHPGGLGAATRPDVAGPVPGLPQRHHPGGLGAAESLTGLSCPAPPHRWGGSCAVLQPRLPALPRPVCASCVAAGQLAHMRTAQGMGGAAACCCCCCFCNCSWVPPQPASFCVCPLLPPPRRHPLPPAGPTCRRMPSLSPAWQRRAVRPGGAGENGLGLSRCTAWGLALQPWVNLDWMRDSLFVCWLYSGLTALGMAARGVSAVSAAPPRASVVRRRPGPCGVVRRQVPGRGALRRALLPSLLCFHVHSELVAQSCPWAGPAPFQGGARPHPPPTHPPTPAGAARAAHVLGRIRPPSCGPCPPAPSRHPPAPSPRRLSLPHLCSALQAATAAATAAAAAPGPSWALLWGRRRWVSPNPKLKQKNNKCE